MLPFEDVDLHIVCASSHTFSDTLLDTLVVRNIDPISQLQESTDVLASAVFQRPVEDILN